MSEFAALIDKVRGSLSLSSVIGRFIKIKRHGHEYTACCPFHGEKTPSFTINDQKGFYHCFGCGAHGDVLRFMTDYHKLPFMEALKQLADIAGVAVPTQDKHPIRKNETTLFDLLECATIFFEKSLPQSSFAMEALTKRGLNEASIQKFRLGFAAQGLSQYLADKGFCVQDQVRAGLVLDRSAGRGGSPYVRFQNRLMIPICDEKGRVIGFGGRSLSPEQQPKYINSPETDLFHKSRVLYGLHHVKKVSVENPLVVVEGYFDAITALQAGILAVAPLGTALTQEHMQKMWRFMYDPILCFDGDTAGQKAMVRAAYHALPLLKPGYSFRFATLPIGEDPDSMIRSKGIGVFSTYLKAAQPMVDILCDHYKKSSERATPEIKARLKKEFMQALETIQDKDIRSFYKQVFFEKTYTRKKGAQLSADTPQPVAFSFQTQQALTEKILLVTLLNHPTLISVMAEHLVQMDFTLDPAKELIQAMLLMSGTDTEEGKNVLMAHSFSQLLKNDENLFFLAPFARENAPLEEAEEGFLDIWQNYAMKTHLKYTVEDYRRKLKESWDLETWNTLKHMHIELQKC